MHIMFEYLFEDELFVVLKIFREPRMVNKMFLTTLGCQIPKVIRFYNEQTGLKLNKFESIRKKGYDSFIQEYMQKKIKLSPMQKIILSVGSAVTSLIDPRRHDMIAAFGETTGKTALQNILIQMKNSTEGCQLLQEKPRINTSEIDIEYLQNLNPKTFGYAYAKFLSDNNVTPDSRMCVRFIEDPELAYIMTRYRECHDLVHAILGMSTNMLGEVTVKWVEALNIGLPMCYGAAIFGAMRLKKKHRNLYIKHYLPWAIKSGCKIKPLSTIYWEKRWYQDISELREELGINLLMPVNETTI